MNKENTPEGKVLGRQVGYPQHYMPEMLVRVPRSINREQYGINGSRLPFTGFDVWNCYEFSFLTRNGLPVAGILKIIYPCESEYLVESKSLKLYLNSFNMEPFGNTAQQGLTETVGIIRKDLSALLECEVKVTGFGADTYEGSAGIEPYDILENSTETDQIRFSQYTETPDLLTVDFDSGRMTVVSHLLRSNCKITHQPDWGSIYILMEGNRIPTRENLLKYIVSLRNENHFHEEICEMVFQRLNTLFFPNRLMVACTYTRRGGIDINPVRALFDGDIPTLLVSPAHKIKGFFRQ